MLYPPAAYEVPSHHEMRPIMQKLQKYAYALLRVLSGFLFFWHGSQKIFGFPALSVHLPPYIVIIAGGIELAGGLLIMTGFLTRPAAFISSGEMAYAYWFKHASAGVLPLVNHGELAVLYCFIFLFIFTAGPGIFSIDSLIHRKRASEEP